MHPAATPQCPDRQALLASQERTRPFQDPKVKQGEKGDTGDRGPAGPSCPDGYSLQPPADDPDALVCRRDVAPDPEPGNGNNPQAAALAPTRRQYP
ncbi:hypothetical protein GCM10010094_89060 [Streptomyces flaveus]|uniref:Uncharacterized protein n=1 Tax=Streptomyces flaveus TaxID=66370 RepID=A0A917RLI3_9ACTN|nr:hypothetical protein GCM10010094_89060 [Streptomyces flaveus]